MIAEWTGYRYEIVKGEPSTPILGAVLFLYVLFRLIRGR